MLRWLPALLMIGCQAPRVVSATSDFDVEPTLTFADGWVGHATVRTLTISSRARVNWQLSLETSAPFSVDDDAVTLPAGDTLEVPVRFLPSEAGPVTGMLRVGSVEVRLEGMAQVPPSCVSPSACQRSVFDPLRGECVSNDAADGAACSDACTEQGTCQAGACVGATRSCDDQNPCTRDLCSAAEGCQHVDATSECPVNDPCQAPACSAQRGCFTVPVDDGSSCGTFSCSLAHVCLRGRCEAVVPPDGATCASQTSCRPRGTCESGTCVAGPVRPLEPEWTLTMPVTSVAFTVHFTGVTDDEGNIYWLECLGSSSCRAASADTRGAIRFRTALEPIGQWVASVLQLFDEGRFVMVTPDGMVRAFDGRTGAVQWTQLLGGVDPALALQQVLSDGRGQLWVSFLSSVSDPTLNDFTLVALDAATGTVLGQQQRTVGSRNMVIDRNRKLFFKSDAQSLTALDHDGRQVFEVELDGGFETITGVAGPILELDSSERVSTSGSPLPRLGRTVPAAASLLFDDGRSVRVEVGVTPGPGPLQLDLMLYDPAVAGGRVLGWFSDRQIYTAPLLISDQLVLFAGHHEPEGMTVRAVGVDGSTVLECPLVLPTPWRGVVTSTTSFTGTHLVLENTGCVNCPRFAAYPLGAIGGPVKGWVTEAGTPGRARRPVF